MWTKLRLRPCTKDGAKGGATSTIPRSDELISKLYGSFTMGGPNEECKILIQSIYESFLGIGIAGRSAAQIFTDAAYTEESLKLFFGKSEAGIMHDFSYGFQQHRTRALASIFPRLLLRSWWMCDWVNHPKSRILFSIHVAKVF